MVHPKRLEPWRAAWFAWLLGRPFDKASLPPVARAFELPSAAGSLRRGTCGSRNP